MKYKLIKDAEGLYLENEAGERYSTLELLSDGSRVIAFTGEMGAGKTTLIKDLCEKLGTEDILNSPTFSIVNVYGTADGEIYHFDCYRLKNVVEAQEMGAEEYLHSGNLCLIEWPEVIEDLLDEKTKRIKIENNDGKREVIIED